MRSSPPAASPRTRIQTVSQTWRLTSETPSRSPFPGHCAKAKKGKVDINTATRDQLLLVPGMDAALADAIIKYREGFGGFVALTELKSAIGLEAETYKRIVKPLVMN